MKTISSSSAIRLPLKDTKSIYGVERETGDKCLLINNNNLIPLISKSFPWYTSAVLSYAIVFCQYVEIGSPEKNGVIIYSKYHSFIKYTLW